MLRSYFVIAIRNLKRNLNYTILNMVGLTLSIASCLIIFLITKNELTYDTYHTKADRTYRVTMHALDYNPSVSLAVGPAMRSYFPELEQVAEILPERGGLVKVGNTRYKQDQYAYVNNAFTQTFDYKWLSGNPHTALAEPNTIVLTASVAKKFFGKQDPMGQTIELENNYPLKVSGVIEDLPSNTNTTFGFLVSIETIKNELTGARNAIYNINGAMTYIVLPPGYTVDKIQRRMHDFTKQNWGDEVAKGTEFPLQPLKDVHFDSRYISSNTANKNTCLALIAIAVFIIITACINFINLATAQAMKRARETGVRKALGADRPQLIRQYLGETGILVMITVALGLVLAYIGLPQVASWLNVRITIQQLNQPMIYFILAALTITIILMAGLYPAFVQSSFKPALSLKGSAANTTRGLTLRKSLVFVQFLVSQVLIIGTLVVAKQMDFFKNQDLGFNKEAVLSFPLPDTKKYELMAEQLRQNTGVKEISFSSAAPSYNRNFAPFTCPSRGLVKDDVMELKFVDEQYLKMFDIKLLAGEAITITTANDSIAPIVVNETLIHKLGIKQPQDAIGIAVNTAGKNTIIKGVIADFQSESKHKERRPVIMMYFARGFHTAAVRVTGKDIPGTIARIEKDWSAMFPEELFSYEFIDDHIATLYVQEQKLFTAYRIFSILAIAIGCLGLYGLVTFAAVQRTKEIGIRKALGASITDIIVLFGKEFILLIVIAFCVAVPISYYLMHNWLQNFAYHISLGVSIFLTAIISSLLIAAITIAHQSIKAAVANPLKSLKTE